MEPEVYRDLVDSYIEASGNPRRQKLILTMIVGHYNEKNAKKLLPGLTSWQYQEVIFCNFHTNLFLLHIFPLHPLCLCQEKKSSFFSLHRQRGCKGNMESSELCLSQQ